MRRIILALSFLALTSCDVQRADPGAVVPEDATATTPDTASSVAPDDASAGVGDGASGGDASPDDPANLRTIVIVGTSLTAGYGVGAELAYPTLLQQKIDSAGLPFRIVNAGISGETTAGGLRRIDWSLQQPTDVLVLELGANDALRGLDPDGMRSNLDAILARARELYPDIALVLIGMQAPPNLGERYTRDFRDAFTDLAREYDAALVPFLLDGVAGDPSLNIEDGIHPNAWGHQVIANNVWVVLVPVLTERERLRVDDG